MNNSLYRFTLDVQESWSQTFIPVKQGDTKRELHITLSDGGTPFIINDGCLANFVGKKADGTTLYNTCEVKENNTVIYKFTEQTSNVPGVVDCEIEVTDTDSKVIASAKFILVVDERVGSISEVVSADEATTIRNYLLNEAARIMAEIQRVEAEDARKAFYDGFSGKLNENTNAISNETSNRESADTTLQGNIYAEATARGNADEALDERVTANTEALGVLNGEASVENSVKWMIATALAELLENDDNTFESMKALVEYVEEHAGDAVNMANGIAVNKENIADEIKKRANENASIRKWIEALQLSSGVGMLTEALGEVFNDYENNRAGSKAFTIEGVERERELMDVEWQNGYHGIFNTPTTSELKSKYGSEFLPAYYNDFSDSDSLNASAGESLGLMEQRVGNSVVEDGVLKLKSRGESVAKYKLSVNTYPEKRKDGSSPNDYPYPEASGKSFVYSVDYKLGDVVWAGTLGTLGCRLVYKGDVVRTDPVTIDASGNIVVDGTVVGKLHKDRFTNVAYFVDVPNNVIDIYINGARVVRKRQFLTSAQLGTLAPYFDNGFALSYVGLYREASGEQYNGTVFYYDNVSLYFVDKYEFGIDGAYILDAVESPNATFDTQRLKAGDEFSVHVCYGNVGHGPWGSEQVENYGKITAIEGNKVYVSKLFCNGVFTDKTSSGKPIDLSDDHNTFRIISKPDAGTRYIGKHSHAGGRNSKALQKGGVSFGNNNTVAGAWAGAIGSGLFAAYAAFAINNNNKARAHNSFAGGADNEIEKQASCGAVLGRGNIVSLADEFICGEYAKLDVPDPADGNRGKYLFKIGNGEKKGNVITRSDAFAVDRDGNAYAGEKKLATEEVVDEKVGAIVEELVDTSPTTLNTLKELSAALNNDEDFAAKMLEKHTEMEDRIASNESGIKEVKAAYTNKLNKKPFTSAEANKAVIIDSDGGLISSAVSIDSEGNISSDALKSAKTVSTTDKLVFVDTNGAFKAVDVTILGTY